MKKVYLTGAVIAFSGLAFAQINSVAQSMKNIELHNTQNEIHHPTMSNDNRAEGDVIVSDDFSTPANWITPVDAGGYNWTIGSTTPTDINDYMGSMASTTAGNGFASFSGITLLLNTPFSAQDAVVELVQTINCSGVPGVVLEFEQRYRAFNADETIVEVSGDNGVTWTEYLVNDQIVTNADATQNTITLNISAVAGNSANVKVRFRWRELGADQQFGAGYGWMVDDLKVSEAWNYESALVAPTNRMGVGMTYTDGLDYGYIPTTQIAEIQYAGKIQNNGGLIQTGSQLGVDIMYGGSSVYSESSSIVDIAVLATDSFAVMPAFTPSGLGVYDVTMTASQTNTENSLADNVSTHSFEVTEYTFSRDNGIETGSISNVGNNDGGDLQIGNVMNVFNNGLIGALDIKLASSATNIDKIMFGAVYVLNAAADGYDWVGQTNDYTIQNGDLNSFVKLFLADPINVTANQEILIVAGHYGDDVDFSYAQGTEDGTVLGFTDGGSSLFQLTGASAIMIRADMRDFTGVEETEVISNVKVSQNVPNPFTSNTVISYNLNETTNVSIKIVDVTGKVISTINEGSKVAGAHNITIDGTSLAAGTYFYTLTAGEFQVTKRMVVSK